MWEIREDAIWKIPECATSTETLMLEIPGSAFTGNSQRFMWETETLFYICEIPRDAYFEHPRSRLLMWEIT